MNLTTEDLNVLSLLVSAGNMFKFEGQEWEYTVGLFGKLTEGNPEKAKDMLETLRTEGNATLNPSARQMYNMYLELMLYVTDHMVIPEDDNT